MENIVNNDEVNLPNNTEQGQLVPTPSEEPVSILDNAATASAYFVQDALQDTPQPQEQGSVSEQPMSGQLDTSGIAGPPGTESANASADLPIRAITPMVGVGLPPWLQSNPRVMPTYPDLPNWREQIRQTQLQAAFPERTERTLLDIPYTYAQQQVPLLDEQTGSSLEDTFQRMQSRSRSIALRSELSRLTDYRPYQNTPPSNELNPNTNVPGSNRSIFRNNMRYDGSGWSNDDRTPVQQLEDYRQDFLAPVRDIWNLLTGGEGSESQRAALNDLVYEYVLGNPVTGESSGRPINDALDTLQRVGEMFPESTRNVMETLSNAAPEPQTGNPTQYRNDWINGYFGEYGRGWVGALNTGLSYTENLGMAAVYSATDLGVALTNQLGIDIPAINSINVDFDDVISGMRFRQAFGGMDLDITNVRDGQGNRYLNFIDPRADRQTQIQQGAAGLAISALFGSSIDDALSGGMRFSRIYMEAMRRGMRPGQAMEAARRTIRIQDLRRARMRVPRFSGEDRTPPATFTSENPNVPLLNNPNPAIGELPELSPAAGVVINLDEYTNPVLTPDFTSANISPSQIAEEFNINPMATPPLPFFQPRSNDDLLRMGQQLGLIDPEQNILTNSDVARLQQVYGGSFSRFGPPAAPDVPNPNYIDVPAGTPENTGRYTVTEMVSPEYPNYVISAPAGYRLPEGFTVEEVFKELQERHNTDTVDWTLGEAIHDGIIPYTTDVDEAYNRTLRELSPTLNYGAVMFQGAGDNPATFVYSYESLMDNIDQFPIAEYNVQGILVGHGTGTMMDPRAWFSESGQRSWQSIVDEYPAGTRMMVMSCSLERNTSVNRTDQWVILESGSDEVIDAGEGNFIELPDDWEADMAMFGPTDLDTSQNYIFQYPESIEVFTPEWTQELARRVQERIKGDESAYNHHIERLIDDGADLDDMRNWVIGGDESVETLQRQQNDVIRETGEAGPEEAARANQMIRQSQPGDSLSNTIRWQLDEAPNDMTGSTRLAQSYLETSDDFVGASRGLQDLELEIDNLRRGIIERSNRLVGQGDLAKYGRGAINDEITTANLYDNVVPGTQIQDLLEPVEPANIVDDGVAWYHGTKQQGIDRVNFHHGAAHEWGVGLYVTRDADYANVAARAARTPNNPVPGTTRLRPDGSGAIYQIQADASSVIDALAPASKGVIEQFSSAVRTIFGKRFSEYWDNNIGAPNAGDMWIRTRELYSDFKGDRIPELRYREFSREVSNKLHQTGYRGIEDAGRGQRLLFPDPDGRIPMRAIPVQEGIGSDSKLESLYARRWMDAELHDRMKSPVTEAWELQSRVRTENSMMEEMFKAYNPAERQTEKLLSDMLQQERQLQADTRALGEMDLEDLQASAPEAAMKTPEFERFQNTKLDDPCI